MSSPFTTFPIVVLGDSIQWGQGLRPGAAGSPSDKMAELVGAALASNNLVTNPTVIRFAQSGAPINGMLHSIPTAPTSFPEGEVPSKVPTILDQIAGAPGALNTVDKNFPPPIAPFAPSTVQLVIMDGGINDVGLFEFILNPFADPETVTARTITACGVQMSSLLTAVGSAFPNAVIVVTGYYQILSQVSDPVGLAITVGGLIGGLVTGILGPAGWLVGVLSGQTVASTAAATVIANCNAFKTTSDTELRLSVNAANAAPGGRFLVQNATPVDRFQFIQAPFLPENALLENGNNGDDKASPTAPAFLWAFDPSLESILGTISLDIGIASTIGGFLGSLFGDPAGGSVLGAIQGAQMAMGNILSSLTAVDEVVSSRVGICGGDLTCNLASVGHPNIEGEAAYANAIIGPMITMFGTTIPSLALIAVGGALNSSGCLIVTAALGSSEAVQVDRLRKLRDEFILRSRLGGDFFAAASKEYYAFSPIIAARMNSSFEFKDRVRCFAVAPFLGFVELLGSWASGRDTDELQVALPRTLDASLKNLAACGIADGQVAAAAEEISRLSAHPTPGLKRISAELQGTELTDVVNYFNAVVGRTLPSNGTHIDVLLLQPLKIYWRLLRMRAALASGANVRSQFDAEMEHWLIRIAALESLSQCSEGDLAADFQMLCDLIHAEEPVRQMFDSLRNEGSAP